jgi:hypothetical protein
MLFVFDGISSGFKGPTETNAYSYDGLIPAFSNLRLVLLHKSDVLKFQYTTSSCWSRGGSEKTVFVNIFRLRMDLGIHEQANFQALTPVVIG